MLHKRRRWCVTPVDSPEQLARDLTSRTWTLCSGFELQGYLFLNDSTSEDGGQEYAVVRVPATPGEPYRQVESITFGWCDYETALAYVQMAVAGKLDDDGTKVAPVLEPLEMHGFCPLCRLSPC